MIYNFTITAFNVKRNLLIIIKIQDRDVFFLFLKSLKLLNLVQ